MRDKSNGIDSDQFAVDVHLKGVVGIYVGLDRVANGWLAKVAIWLGG